MYEGRAAKRQRSVVRMRVLEPRDPEPLRMRVTTVTPEKR